MDENESGSAPSAIAETTATVREAACVGGRSDARSVESDR